MAVVVACESNPGSERLAINTNQSALKDAVVGKISDKPVENFVEKMRKIR